MGSLVVVGVVWELLVRYQLTRLGRFLPPPSELFVAFLRGTQRGVYYRNSLITLTELGLGVLLGGSVAVVLGMAIVRYSGVEWTVMPLIVGFQAVPKLILAPLFVFWLGFGLASKVWLVAVVAFFPILINGIAGFRAIEGSQAELLRSLGARPRHIFRYLRIPNAAPYLFAGLRVAVVYGLSAAVVSEFVGATGGLGLMIMRAGFDLDLSGQFAVVALLSLYVVLIQSGVGFAEKRLIFWSPRSDDAAVKSSARNITAKRRQGHLQLP